jgi:DNA-binding transcriptional LysR family regulator
MDSLFSMRVFCLVAELKSFATAAQRLRISPAMASKHVMQLESGWARDYSTAPVGASA